MSLSKAKINLPATIPIAVENMNVLASPGLGWDAKMFREEASALPRVRGLLAPPSSNLAPLKNVGGMCKVRARFAPMPFVDVAHEALMADPLPRDVSLPNWRQIPDSAKYARHVAYMVKHSVLRKVLDPDDGGRRWGVFAQRCALASGGRCLEPDADHRG